MCPTIKPVSPRRVKPEPEPEQITMARLSQARVTRAARIQLGSLKPLVRGGPVVGGQPREQ